MRETAHGVYSIVGRGYAAEQHNDEMPRQLAPSEINGAVISLAVSMFSEVLQSLGASLSANQAKREA